MFPSINPRDMQKMMKKLGMRQEEIDAKEVIIICNDKKLIISNPQVSKIQAMGQETIQVIGNIEEQPLAKFSQDDIETVIEQTNCTEQEAKKALEETNDIAEAILKLKK